MTDQATATRVGISSPIVEKRARQTLTLVGWSVRSNVALCGLDGVPPMMPAIQIAASLCN